MPPADVEADAVVPAIGAGNGAATAAGGRPGASAAAAAPAAPLAFAPSTASAAPVGGSLRPSGAPPSSSSRPPLFPPPPPPPGGALGGGAPGGAGGDDDPAKAPFWSPRRYRPYFDVDTARVLDRLAHSFLGPFRPSFMAATADDPDIYGPFWVATTLVLVTAVAGNYADYLSFSRWAGGAGAGGNGASSAVAPPPPPGGGNGTDAGTVPPEIPYPPGTDAGQGASSGGPRIGELQWYNDYAKVSYSALLFYGYVFALGFALWFALRWFRSEMRLANVWCVYGYSMTAFVPAAFLCIAPAAWARTLVVAVATASSGLFLVANLKTAIFEAAPARATALLGVVVAAHAGVGLALRMYLFSFSSKEFAMGAAAGLPAGGGGGGGGA